MSGRASVKQTEQQTEQQPAIPHPWLPRAGKRLNRRRLRGVA